MAGGGGGLRGSGGMDTQPGGRGGYWGSPRKIFNKIAFKKKFEGSLLMFFYQRFQILHPVNLFFILIFEHLNITLQIFGKFRVKLLHLID